MKVVLTIFLDVNDETYAMNYGFADTSATTEMRDDALEYYEGRARETDFGDAATVTSVNAKVR